MSAQKAIQWSETEMKDLFGGTEENNVSPISPFIDFPLILHILQKRNRINFLPSMINVCTNTQSRFTSVVGVLKHLRLVLHIGWRPCISVVPDATHKAKLRALSAQKALQRGPETDMM